MGATGGAATAIGIWYQTIGAAVALVDPWTCKRIEPYIDFENIAVVHDQRPNLIIEYFDMDAAIIDHGEVELIQFKVSTQQEPPGFNQKEVWEILKNATRAILKHEQENNEKIVGFIVATNRPIGRCLDDLQQIVKNHAVELDKPECLAQFANAPAPSSLFAKNKQAKTTKKNTPTSEKTTGTMRDLALRIMQIREKQSKEKTDKCINACLKAMACFRFAKAKPVLLKEKLHEWFRTWGILKGEDSSFTDYIIGALQSPLSDGSLHNELSIMRRVFHSLDAVPINPHCVWGDVVKDLCNRRSPDPPTEIFIERKGVPYWLMNRSALLRGLPYKYQEDPTVELDSDESYFRDTSVQPRIIALVGDGGNGKTRLMFHLFEQIAGGIWDWAAEDFQKKAKFIGYPIIRAPGKSALEALSGALENWGRRNEYTDKAIKRFVAASRCKENDPAVWLGLDGVDETPEANLPELANDLANWAYSNANVRIVLTCRPEQFRLLINGLSHDGLMRQVNVSEFNQDDAWKAVMKATNQEFQRSQPTRFATIGQRRDAGMLKATDPEGFEASIRQPLFVGVVHNVYKDKGIKWIQAAYDGNEDAFRTIATEYINVFCERLRRRFNRAYIDRRGIFRALKQLAANIDNPEGENRAYWKGVCKAQLDGRIEWYKLYDQCAASGLIIKKEGAGSFEWKHKFVRKYLPTMEGDPTWR